MSKHALISTNYLISTLTIIEGNHITSHTTKSNSNKSMKKKARLFVQNPLTHAIHATNQTHGKNI